jgi:hypothetical protein
MCELQMCERAILPNILHVFRQIVQMIGLVLFAWTRVKYLVESHVRIFVQ